MLKLVYNISLPETFCIFEMFNCFVMKNIFGIKALFKFSLSFLLFTFSLSAYSQCKTYKLSATGDTLNCTDMKNLRQGKWIERTNALRGNPGFDEEGEYVNGRREGLWRKYNLSGDVLNMQHYRWGLLDGKAQYFTIDGLEREESWRAIDPEKKFDTIDVPDLYKPDVYTQVVIKNEGRSLRQGKWTYYDPRTGFILKSETYVRDSLENPLAMFGIKEKAATRDTTGDAAKKLANRPDVIKEWEKKNAGKKKVKIRDGRTGM
jgi:hypothetical protein